MAASAIFVSAAVRAWEKVFVLGVFGGAAILLASLALSRHPALRVDTAGVTMRPYPLRFSVIAFYPWEDVARILIVQLQDLAGSTCKSSFAKARL